LSYADAVRLLGAGESPIMSGIGRLAGEGATLANAVALGATDLLGLRDEIIKWGQQTARSVRERMIGLDRFDRTERISAAHSVIVTTSFFEVLYELLPELDDELARVRMTLGEQVSLRTRTAAFERSRLLSALVDARVPLPSPAVTERQFEQSLYAHYGILVRSVEDFAAELTGRRTDPSSERIYLPNLLDEALRRYSVAYRSLADDVPEFAIWAAMSDAGNGIGVTAHVGDEVREESAEMDRGMAGVRQLLASLMTGGADASRLDLAAQYRADLNRAILSASNLPDGITMPTAGALYINPRARVLHTTRGNEPIAAEFIWRNSVVLTDIQPFLAAHFTGPTAVRAPLIVLGHPGAGKSMLSRILAANLSAGQFMPVRVELRSVHADGMIQNQIESAVYAAIGERVTWPNLVRSSAGALPVVILDGFDELLQASGVNRANYLEQIQEFQLREAELGRPLAVVVTSRTVVADRARVPAESTVLRLEPFDDDQVRRWLKVWAATNVGGLAARSLVPLTAGVALNYRELAQQPLLLLMLALYDAWENALQKVSSGLDRADLYERLFTDFAHREIGKREPGAPRDLVPGLIARELRDLELVAIAMFARGAQVIWEEQLNADLPILTGDGSIGLDRSRAADRPLTAAQLLVGRFFFVHESQAREGVETPMRSFEFLHATFGEFLVARLVVGTLVDLVEEQEGQARRRHPTVLDAGLLYAWLSFAVLTSRTPVVEFCRAMLSQLPSHQRLRCHDLLLDLLQDAGMPHPTWSLTDYRPVRHTVSMRHAAFTANLVTLIVLLGAKEIETAELFPEHSRLAWRSHSLLWKSQLPADSWDSLWQSMRMTHEVGSENRAVRSVVSRLSREDGAPVSMLESLSWDSRYPTGADRSLLPSSDVVVPATDTVGQWLREAAFQTGDDMTRELLQSLAPLWQYQTPVSQYALHYNSRYPFGRDVALLFSTLLLRASVGSEYDPTQLRDLYEESLTLFQSNAAGHGLLMRAFVDDAADMNVAVILTTLNREGRAIGAAVRSGEWALSGKYWVSYFNQIARLIAIVYRATGSTAELQFALAGFRDAASQPSIGLSFASMAEQEFSELGLDFPDEWRQQAE
jgi:hypothetical protein